VRGRLVVVGEILVATSGYSYDDWVGPVYPAGTGRNDFLAHYARMFRFTELNFTYYRETSAEGLSRIAARAPADFRFVVKGHRRLTHDRDDGWKASAERLGAALHGLGPSGRLLGVLLQFPFSFHYTITNRRYLASVTDALSDIPLFAEFRNVEWDKPAVWTELERRAVGLVVPDLPKLEGLPRTEPRLTGRIGYLRFHGRNSANWWNGTNVTRYDYRYSQAELQDWVGPVRDLAGKAEAVIVTFNNHFAGQAVANAREFMELLGLVA
jgi:uncharacterized protein YecE (DUF72 family)